MLQMHFNGFFREKYTVRRDMEAREVGRHVFRVDPYY